MIKKKCFWHFNSSFVSIAVDRLFLGVVTILKHFDSKVDEEKMYFKKNQRNCVCFNFLNFYQLKSCQKKISLANYIFLTVNKF